MGQGEILNLLEENPRLTTREIAEFLNFRKERVSRLLYKLMKSKEVISDDPTKEELKKILIKFPKSIHAIWHLKVFEVNDE